MAISKLTIHVLDTVHGVPGAGIGCLLYRHANERWMLITSAVTNGEGRCETPLLQGKRFTAGRYRIMLDAGAYFTSKGIVLPAPQFVDELAIDFGVADASATYNVSLLVSPWGYTVYRGN